MKKELAPEWALLGLLTQKPMHGYELYRYFTDPSALGQVWYLGLSQMYKLLKELEAQGHVEASVESQESYPPRKVYHITPAGRAAFWQWMEKPVRNTRLIRVEFLAKLFLAQLLGSKMIGRLIDAQLETCQAQLARLQEKIEMGDDRRASGEGFEYLIFCFRRGQIQAIVDWLRTCRCVFLEE
jgi:PadR family transcriptional regulator AphA